MSVQAVQERPYSLLGKRRNVVTLRKTSDVHGSHTEFGPFGAANSAFTHRELRARGALPTVTSPVVRSVQANLRRESSGGTRGRPARHPIGADQIAVWGQSEDLGDGRVPNPAQS
jgi:hypothetical protein